MVMGQITYNSSIKVKDTNVKNNYNHNSLLTDIQYKRCKLLNLKKNIKCGEESIKM